MASEEFEIVRLRTDFYRDGFYKVVMALMLMGGAVVLLVALSFYLISEKPTPVNFYAGESFRAFPPAPVDQPYIKTADLLQWVNNVLPAAFTVDFLNYKTQMQAQSQYFTANGWAKFTALLNTYANPQVMQASRLYIQATPTGAPFILNQGLVSGKYGWWVQMPLDLIYSGVDQHVNSSIVVQILVTRVSTLEDLSGVAIDNAVVVTKGG